VVDGDAYTAEQMEAYADAREAAVLAKLARQEPVAWQVHPFDYGIGHQGVYATTHLPQQRDAWIRKGWAVQALYTRPAPQQADRQQVPDGWKLVPVVPTNEMTSAMADVLDDPENDRSSWDLSENMYRAAMLAAAPEAPAQASESDERDRKDAERYRWLREQMLGVDFDWDESGKTALCFEMPDGCSFAADCDQVIDDASAALAQKGGR